MKFRIVSMLSIVYLLSQTASAQTSFPRFEAFAGFSYLPAGPEDFPRDNSFGFQAGIAANMTRWFGVAGDFGGQYSTGDAGRVFPGVEVRTSVYEFLVGPRFSLRRRQVHVFTHFLAGGASGRTNLAGFSDTELTLGAGAGVDIAVSPRVAIRAIQFDWLGSFTDMLEDNVRAGAGLVFKF
jgi:hypothetical protein